MRILQLLLSCYFVRSFVFGLLHTHPCNKAFFRTQLFQQKNNGHTVESYYKDLLKLLNSKNSSLTISASLFYNNNSKPELKTLEDYKDKIEIDRKLKMNNFAK